MKEYSRMITVLQKNTVVIINVPHNLHDSCLHFKKISYAFHYFYMHKSSFHKCNSDLICILDKGNTFTLRD